MWHLGAQRFRPRSDSLEAMQFLLRQISPCYLLFAWYFMGEWKEAERMVKAQPGRCLGK